MTTFKTAYVQGYMDSVGHGNLVFNWNDWRQSRVLIPIAPYFRTYDDITTPRCWADAVGRLFGEPLPEGQVLFLPNYPGTNENCKFYYHKSGQLWRLTKQR